MDCYRERLDGLKQTVHKNTDINGSASEVLDDSEEHSGENLYFLTEYSDCHKLTVGRNVGFKGIVSRAQKEMRTKSLLESEEREIFAVSW